MKNMVRKMKEYKKYKIPPQDKQLTINSLKDSVLNIKKIDLEDKKNVSILIIDDEGYDIDILSNLGYLDIDKQLAHTKISDYSRYDVIFCDINNIANEFPKQGADLAKQIKETYPEKTVVIFTGCDQNINISSYKDYVDYLIEKNADPIELVNIINRHIERKYNPIVYWENIEKVKE